MDAVLFGRYVSRRRKELGLTQDQLGEMTLVSGKAVSKWERGIGFPDINTLEPLARSLDVSLSELMQAGIDPAPKDAEEASRALAETAAVAARQLRYYKRALTRRALFCLSLTAALAVIVYFIVAMTRLPYMSDPVWGAFMGKAGKGRHGGLRADRQHHTGRFPGKQNSRKDLRGIPGPY